MAENQTKTASDSKLLKENQELKKMLLTAKTALEEHKKSGKQKDTVIETLTSKVANIEKERREERIASILQGAYKDEELKEQIESFAKSGMVFEAIEKAVLPLKVANKVAAEQEQAKTTEAQVNEKAAELAKSASKNTKNESKVAIKNAAVTHEPAENPVPAWIRARQHLLGGGIS